MRVHLVLIKPSRLGGTIRPAGEVVLKGDVPGGIPLDKVRLEMQAGNLALRVIRSNDGERL